MHVSKVPVADLAFLPFSAWKLVTCQQTHGITHPSIKCVWVLSVYVFGSDHAVFLVPSKTIQKTSHNNITIMPPLFIRQTHVNLQDGTHRKETL